KRCWKRQALVCLVNHGDVSRLHNGQCGCAGKQAKGYEDEAVANEVVGLAMGTKGVTIRGSARCPFFEHITKPRNALLNSKMYPVGVDNANTATGKWAPVISGLGALIR